MGDREDGAAGVPVQGAVGAQLLEMPGGSDAGLLLEFACGRVARLLMVAQEATRQGQVVPEWLDASAHDEGVEGVVNDGQSDDVDRDREGQGLGHGASLTYLCRVDIKSTHELSSE